MTIIRPRSMAEARRSLAQLERKAGFMRVEKKSLEDDILFLLRSLIESRAFEKSGLISKNTAQQLRGYVSSLYAEEQAAIPPLELARSIERYAGTISRYRAEAIARTETTSALQQTSLTIAKSELAEDDMLKLWVSGGDSRTRSSHVEADGQAVGMDEEFIVGGARLKYPGDPQGPAEEVVNCRCALIYRERTSA